MVPLRQLSLREFGFRPNRRENRVVVSGIRQANTVLYMPCTAVLFVSFCISVSKALQDFDLALRGKKKREKFLKDNKRKKELTVILIFN